MDIEVMDTTVTAGEAIAFQGQTIHRLLCIMNEEVLANGGHFISPDSDLWLRQLADVDEPLSSLDIIQNLLKKYEQR